MTTVRDREAPGSNLGPPTRFRTRNTPWTARGAPELPLWLPTMTPSRP